MSATPLVSVVIPSHARPDLVQRAARTAAAQTGIDLELVVVDDGSPVPVEGILDGADLGGVPLRVLRSDRATGVSAARNRGIREARGRWVALLDDDDLWAPGKLAAQVGAMERTGARWSHTGTLWLDGDLSVRFASLPGGGASTLPRVRGNNFVGTPSSVVAERELLLEEGGFDAAFSVMADWDMWLRLAARGDGVGVDEPLIGYVVHPGSMHRASTRLLLGELRALRHKHAALGAIGGVETWRWLAETARDRGRRATAIGLYAGVAARFRDRRALGAIRDVVTGRVRDPWWALPGPETPEWVARWQG